MAKVTGLSLRQVQRYAASVAPPAVQPAESPSTKPLTTRVFAHILNLLMEACDLEDSDVNPWLLGPDSPVGSKGTLGRWRDAAGMPNLQSFVRLGYAIQSARVSLSTSSATARPTSRSAGDKILDAARTPFAMLASSHLAGQLLEFLASSTKSSDTIAAFNRPLNLPVTLVIHAVFDSDLLEEAELTRLIDNLTDALAKVSKQDSAIGWFVPNTLNTLPRALVRRGAGVPNKLSGVLHALHGIDLDYLKGREAYRVKRAWLLGWVTWWEQALNSTTSMWKVDGLGLPDDLMNQRIPEDFLKYLEDMDGGFPMPDKHGTIQQPDAAALRRVDAIMRANIDYVEAYNMSGRDGDMTYESAAMLLSKLAAGDTLVAALDFRTLRWTFKRFPELQQHPGLRRELAKALEEKRRWKSAQMSLLLPDTQAIIRKIAETTDHHVAALRELD